jgi:predicted adenine nucleotide alpha hydrolase (AANH) superfamily ATPase
MKILMHICCAPCAVYPLSRLRQEKFDLTGFFYNPNIHPYREYLKRFTTVQEFAARTGLPMIVHQQGYDLDVFLRRVVGTGGGRCERCYRIRLEAVAAEARRSGFGRYSTSLLYSRYQKHDLIRGVAQEQAAEHRIEFYYEDFRKGWHEGIAGSKSLGLYRQQYCGCLYSEQERYLRRPSSGGKGP